MVKNLFKYRVYKLVSNVSLSVITIIEVKEEPEPWLAFSRRDVKHNVLGRVSTLEWQSVREARGGALSPRQASTHRDAAGTIPIRGIALSLEIGR